MLGLKNKQFLAGDDFYCIDCRFLCWKFIIYSLFIYALFSGFEPTSFRFKMKKKCKILRGFEPASFKSAFHAASTEL